MSMVVQNNLQAINAHNRLGVNVLGAKKASEKLSSGFRVNRAGDDAAGLAVSEKMRAQIRGLNQAIRNTNDGISLIQTAEGALDEVHSILKRLKELAVQSATGTYASLDRTYMDLEVQALAEEIGRIGATTDFNGLYLFSEDDMMDLDDAVFHVGARSTNNNEANAISYSIALNTITGEGAIGASQVSIGEIGGTLDLTTISAANEMIDTIDELIDEVNKQRAQWGALQNRLEHTVANLTVTAENLQAAGSQIGRAHV